MELIKKLLLFLGYYLVSWLIAYVLVFILRGEPLDLSFVIYYLVLAWTFSGFELPMFIWSLSIPIFLLLTLAVIPFAKQRLKKSR